VLENEKVTASTLSTLIDLMLSCGTSGNIPQGLDEITVGSADRIRVSSPRVAFIIGANEGVFPPDVKLVSSLTVKERAKLETYGIKLSDCGEWRLAEENLITYCALCCPTERLYVSCSSCAADGTELETGDFYKKIKTCFPLVREYDAGALGGDYYARDLQPAFEQLAGSPPGVFRETLEKYFAGKEDYSGRIVALQRAQGGRNFRIFSRETAEELFGRRMFISPSRIEQYYKCAFSYFCKYGIKAAARKRAELDPIQIGNVNHKVLELLLSEHTRDELTAMTGEEVALKVAEYMRAYYKDVLGSPDDRRFAYIFEHLGESITEVALRLIEEFEYCSFNPVDLELTIGSDGEIPPYIPDGSDNVYIIGKIDRVDTCSDGPNTYFRVVDYKSSDKTFSINEAVNGINLQMLVYLFALWQNASKRYGDGLTPAGILYRSVTAEAINISAGADEDKYEKARLSGFKMRGLVLSDKRVIELMEKGSQGVLLPVRLKKDGEIDNRTKAYAINLKGFASLKKKTDKLINEMAAALRNGETDALPFRKKEDLLYCKYCDYKAVCGYEDDMDSRLFPEAEGKDVIENLENGGDGDVSKVE
jgi:ATP-dependent helicase/nuclease subunit B